ncbi:MAG TPA: type II secretion system protein [Burkholderiales bacterium]|nr:type II secretion system protein [Burkholderiales bacterium]
MVSRDLARNPEPRTRGFTLLELAAAIVLIGALAAVLLNRLAFYQEMAEKAAMEATLRTIKTGLQIRLAELILTNRQAEAERLEAEDPVLWLDEKPPNYGGPYREPPERGTWYYDAPARELVYVVNTGSRLKIGDGSEGRELRFRTRVLKDRVRFGGVEVEGVAGIALTPVRPYHWS